LGVKNAKTRSCQAAARVSIAGRTSAAKTDFSRFRTPMTSSLSVIFAKQEAQLK
jgi:hypothetical protein